MLTVAPPLGRRRDAPWAAALLGAYHSRRRLPAHSLAGTNVVCIVEHRKRCSAVGGARRGRLVGRRASQQRARHARSAYFHF
jgi:hypothetical protein